MLPTRQGSVRLFRLGGIDVFLHWSWFLVAAYTLTSRADEYSSLFWNAAEYLALFAIVLTHEFGHSLACRSTGGYADDIVLWPFGGVAYVQPPPRPGAQLWSIVAGPLVNVLLLPVLFALWWWGGRVGWAQTSPDLFVWLSTVQVLNLVLLVFNLLPIYPLDGGQILRSLLWFALGLADSLIVATVVGFFGGAALIVLALSSGLLWTTLIAGLLLYNCWRGYVAGLALRRYERERAAWTTAPIPPPLGHEGRSGETDLRE